MGDLDIVADSEGEGFGFELRKTWRKDVSSIYTAETSVAARQGRPSSIVTATTSFGASLNALLNTNAEEIATGRPKPRPRPVFRNKDTGTAGAAPSTAFVDTTTTPDEDDMNFPNILSIADRAKMRQRTAKQPSSLSYGQSAHPSHPFDGEDELGNTYRVPDGDEEFNDPLPRPKPKAKPRTKKNLLDILGLHESDPPGSSGKVTYEPNPTLPQLSSSVPYTPEMWLEPPPPPIQTRPKPRPINKAKSSPSAARAQDQPTSQLSIPIATSPLPPSDPPLPSSPPHHLSAENVGQQEIGGSGDGFPPIETLPVPSSSPSSLFSAAVADEGEGTHIASAAGHARDSPYLEDDPLLMEPPSTFFKGASSIGQPKQHVHIAGGMSNNRNSPGLEPDPRFMEPPSTFFKGASSLDHPQALPKPRKKQKRKRVEEHAEVIDLCTLPPKSTDIQIVDFNEITRQKKGTEEREKFEGHVSESGKRKAKRKARDHDDDFGVGLDDDGDGDYEDEDEGKRKKPKTKTKGKRVGGKPSKKSKTTVEVVIDVPTRKTKGKNKAVEVPSAEEELEPLLVGTIADEETRLRTARPPGTPSMLTRELSPVSSVPDSEGEDLQGLFDLEMGATSKGTPAAPTPAPSIGKKQRKAVVYNDEDGANYDHNEDDEIVMSPKKKAKTNGRPKQTQGKSRARGVVLSEEEEDDEPAATTKATTIRKTTADSDGEAGAEDSIQENIPPKGSGKSSKPTSSSHAKVSSLATSDKPNKVKSTDADDDSNTRNIKPVYTSLTSRYTIAPKTKSTPMSELIRRVNSMPLSPLTSPPRTHTKAKDINKSTPTPAPARTGQGVIAYSPYLKTSRTFLSKIAPLHLNRRTPPPPLPPPPPRRKSKKELELEEKWEEELIESVGGPAAWSCLPEDERKEMKRHKWAVERGEIED